MKESGPYSDFSQKLGLKPGDKVLVYNVPTHYGDLLGEITEHIHWLESISNGIADFIHIFCNNEKELHKTQQQYVPALKRTGMLWVSWPKKSSSLFSDMGHEDVKDLILGNTSLEDTNVASIDEDWSALKFVYRNKISN